MDRRSVVIVCLIMIFTVCLASCGGQKREAAADQTKQASENVSVIKSGDDLAFDITFDDFVRAWNGSCSDDIRVPGKDDWESYITDRAIHYKSPEMWSSTIRNMERKRFLQCCFTWTGLVCIYITRSAQGCISA